MICHHCRAQIPDDSMFCAKCGTHLESSAPSTASTSAVNVTQQITNEKHQTEPSDTSQDDDAQVQHNQHRKGIILLILIVVIVIVFYGIARYPHKEDNSPTPSASTSTTKSTLTKTAEATSQWMSDHPTLSNVTTQCSSYINAGNIYSVLDYRLPKTGLNQFWFQDGLLLERDAVESGSINDQAWMCVAQALGMTDSGQGINFMLEVVGGAFGNTFESNDNFRSSLRRQSPYQLGSGIEARSSFYRHVDTKNMYYSSWQIYVFLSDGVTTKHEMLENFLGTETQSSAAPSPSASASSSSPQNLYSSDSGKATWQRNNPKLADIVIQCGSQFNFYDPGDIPKDSDTPTATMFQQGVELTYDTASSSDRRAMICVGSAIKASDPDLFYRKATSLGKTNTDPPGLDYAQTTFPMVPADGISARCASISSKPNKVFCTIRAESNPENVVDPKP